MPRWGRRPRVREPYHLRKSPSSSPSANTHCCRWTTASMHAAGANDRQLPQLADRAQSSRPQLHSPAPNRVWLADITYIPTGEGWLYLAAVMDPNSRKIIGWAMRDHLRTELPLAALMMALQRQRPAAGLIQHSDRGVRYASEEYRAALQIAGTYQSMSRKGDCLENAPMRKLLPHARNRARPLSEMWNESGCSARPVCPHRRIQQSNASPLGT